jgi:hypothetical protein
MRLSFCRVGVCLAAGLLLVTARVDASPVTIDYVVSQIQLCYFHDQSNVSSPPPTCSLLPDPMALTLTYDDGATTTDASPGVATTSIQTLPTFTLAGLVPLANPFGAPVTTAQVFGTNVEGSALRSEYGRAAVDSFYEDSNTSATTFTRNVWITSYDLFADRTILAPQDGIVEFPTTADIEARLRGAFGPLNFRFASLASTLTCDLTTDCATYYNDIVEGSFLLDGVATAVAPAAVPEPTSLLLLGSGVAGAMVRRRRANRSQ